MTKLTFIVTIRDLPIDDDDISASDIHEAVASSAWMHPEREEFYEHVDVEKVRPKKKGEEARHLVFVTEDVA